MATLKETVIEGDFRAEDTIIDLNEGIGSAQDPDVWFNQSTNGIYGGVRIDRGNETAALVAWNESQDRWEIGLEGQTERVLTESDLGAVSGLSIEPGLNTEFQVNASTGATVIDSVPSGSDTQLQFNDNGAFGASSDLVFDGTDLKAPAVEVSDVFKISGRRAVFTRAFKIAVGESAYNQYQGSGSGTRNTLIRENDDSTAYALAGSDNVVVGELTPTSINTSGHVFVGSDAGEAPTTGSESVAIGFKAGHNVSSSASFASTVLVGARAAEDAGNVEGSVALGRQALSGADAQSTVALGRQAGFAFSGDNAVFIGSGAGTDAGDYTQANVSGIAIGNQAFTTAAGQAVIGAPADKGSNPTTITDLYVGEGVETDSPEPLTVHASGAQTISGTKNPATAGADLRLASGVGSGAATGSSISILTPDPETTNYAQQTLSERLRVNATGVYVLDEPTESGFNNQVLARNASTGEVQALPTSFLQAQAPFTATTTGTATENLLRSGAGIVLSSGEAVNFEADVVAQDSSGNVHTWQVRGSGVRTGSNASFVGVPVVESVAYDLSVQALELDVVTTGNEIRLEATGLPGKDVDWTAEIETTTVNI